MTIVSMGAPLFFKPQSQLLNAYENGTARGIGRRKSRIARRPTWSRRKCTRRCGAADSETCGSRHLHYILKGKIKANRIRTLQIGVIDHRPNRHIGASV